MCWLYEGRIDLLSVAAAQAIEHGRLMISPIVDLELQLLHEIGRILEGPEKILSALSFDLGLEMATTAFSVVAAAARRSSWTRDPFDRLIAAQAVVADARLVTKDRVIRKHCAAAPW